MEIPISQFIEMFNGKGYPEKQLSEVCKKITDGTHKTPKYLGEGVTFISAKNIINGRLDFSDIKYISESEYQEIQKRCQTEKGDVLLAKSGSLGMTAIVENDESLGLFESLAILKYDRMLLNGVFLCIQMQSDAVQSQLMSNVKGVAVKHLHLNVIAKTKIIVPPMDLQERFCAFARQSDKSKFACLKSQFIEVFGDPVENPHGWLTKGLMELGSCKNGMNFGAKDIGVTIKSVGVGDIKDYDNIEDIESLTTISLNEMPSEEYMLKDGDLVFVRSNGNKELVGRCVAVYPHETPVSFSGFCIRFRKESSDVLLDYLLRYLKMPEVRAKMAGRGANIQNLNQKILAALQVPVPPLETQMAYVAFVRQSDKSKLCFHLYTTTLHYAHS